MVLLSPGGLRPAGGAVEWNKWDEGGRGRKGREPLGGEGAGEVVQQSPGGHRPAPGSRKVEEGEREMALRLLGLFALFLGGEEGPELLREATGVHRVGEEWRFCFWVLCALFFFCLSQGGWRGRRGGGTVR